MEGTKNNNPLHESQSKGKEFKTQLKTIFKYLQENIATASMVSAATGVPQKNITRFKRDLEKVGRLWEVEKRYCQKTGFRAWYLTTDPEKAPSKSNQMELF